MIKNLLFDLGGVLIDLSPRRTLQAFTLLGLQLDTTLSERDLLGAGGGDLVDRYQVGDISTEDFFDAIARNCGLQASHEAIEEAWYAMLLGIPQQRIQALIQAKQKGLNIYILSNINESHVRWTKDAFAAVLEPLGWTMDQLFTDCFFSNEIQLAKPNPACYDYVLRHAGIRPDETLYFDDLLQNVEAGQRAGFQSRQVYGDEWLPIVESLHNQ